MKSKLLSNSVFYSVIGLLPMSIGFFTLPIMTKYLSPEEYGILSMTIAFTAMVSLISTLQIYSGVARIYFDYNNQERKVYFSTLFYAISAIACLVITFFLFAGDKIIDILYSKSEVGFWPYFFIVVVSILFRSPVLITTAFLRVQEKGKQLLLFSAIGAIITTCFVLYFVVIELMGIMGSLIGSAIGGFATYCLHIYYFRSNFVLKFEKSMFIENLKFGIPLIPYALGGYLFMHSDIIILEKFVTVGMIGLYGIAGKFAVLLKTVVNSFAAAFTPIFMQASKKSIEDGQKIVFDTSKSYLILLGIGYMVLCHFGEYAIYMMTPKPYHESALILPILGMAYVFRGMYIFHINTFYFTKKTKYLPIATISSGVLNVILNILLIPYIGIWGASITTTLCFAFNWWIYEVLSVKTFKLKFETNAIKFLICIVIATNFLFYQLPSHNLYFRILVQIIFVGGVVFFVFYKNFGSIRDYGLEIFKKSIKHT